MQQLKEALLKWADELEHYKTPSWDALPDIDLYMDQVITYIERQISVFSLSAEEKLITPAMINNYVKNEVIPRPIQKKYTREHLAYMMAVLNLKQVLSLSDITKLMIQETSDKPIHILFDQFNAIQDEALKNTSDRLRGALEQIEGESCGDDLEKRLSLLALKLSLEANASRIAAKRILDEIMARKAKVKAQEEKEKEKIKEKEREKDKNKKVDE